MMLAAWSTWGSSAWAAKDDASSASSTETAESTKPKKEHFRIGAFGGVGFPRPLSIEGMVRIEKVIGLGVEYSVLPKQNIFGADATFWAVAADMRVFPLKNGFFIGVALGHQHVGAVTSTTPIGPVGITAETWFLNPRIGYLSTFDYGFTLGIDAGLQIPLSAKFASNLPAQFPGTRDVTDVAHFFGKSVIPTVNLLRIGFML